MAVADEMEVFPLRDEWEEILQGSARGGAVATAELPSRTGGEAMFLSRSEPTRARMRGRVEAVDEPGSRPHHGGHPEGTVLGELEGLEVIEDDGLRETPPQVRRRAAVEE